jgi:hypothetical protein
VAVVATALAASGPTLIASRHTAGLPAVTYGQSLRLSGHETLGGTSNVVLQTNPFPFAVGFHTVAHEQTKGAYAFASRPTKATRYRVLVKSSRSPVVTVYVIPRPVSSSCNLCSGNNTSGKHTLVVGGVIKPAAGTGPVYFYYAQVNSTVPPTTLRLVKTVTPQVSGGKLSINIHYQVNFPTGSFRFRYEFCRRDDEAHDGFGLPGHHHCGDATIRVGQYLG